MMTLVWLLLSPCFVFRLLFVMSSHSGNPPAIDPGVRSGHETQFVFSEGVMWRSDADNIHRTMAGKSIIPLSIKLL